MLFERMFNKTNEPNSDDIQRHMGTQSAERLTRLEEFLNSNYQIVRELKFPFGKNYGWGYKYSHKRKHICYAFFERDAFTITIQIGDGGVAALEERMDMLSTKARELWDSRYPCGEHGGWVHYRVLGDSDLLDISEFISVKQKPRHLISNTAQILL